MKYFAGSEFNMTVAAGVSCVKRLRLGKGGELSGLHVDGAAFTMNCESAGGGVVSCAVEHGAGDGLLYVHIPALEAHVYEYELGFRDEAGEYGVLLHGRLTAMGRRQFEALVEGVDEAEEAVLEVTASSLHAAPLELRWVASSAASRFAADAMEAMRRAEAAAGLLEAAQAFIGSWNEAVQSAVSVDENGILVLGNYWTGVRVHGVDGVTPHIGKNGNWWSGDVDLGKPSRGEDGLTPSISADGFWVLGDWKSPVRAEGRDGINGSAVRRILVDSVADLPVAGETCNGGFFYYVPNADGEYDVYAWLERKETAGWVRVTQAYDIATAEVYGLNKLGTDSVAEVGAPVAVNAEGGLTVPVASTVDFGAFKASSSVVEKFGGGGIYMQDGKAWVNMATTNKPGCVIYSAWGATPDNYAIGPNTSGWIDVMSAGVAQRGVVYAAADITDEREGAMVSAKQVYDYVSKNHPKFGDVMSQAEVYSFVSNRLVSYYLKSQTMSTQEVQAYVTERVAGCASVEELTEQVKDVVRESASWNGCEVMTEEAYNALPEINEKTLYILI